MKNVYHSDIMQLLLQRGKEGLHVSQVSRMIYNLHNNFFDQSLNYNELHQNIRNYLWRQSQMRRSPFVHIQHGVYAIKADIAIQLDICFDNPLDMHTSDMPYKGEVIPEKEDPRQLVLF